MQVKRLTEIRPNPDNPRVIRDEKFKKLVNSLRDFPEMAKVRPVVVNTDMVVLGGNMRLRAMKEAGWKEVPVEVVDWSEEKQKEFIIKDNVGFGEWDWDELANTWDAEDLNDWGLEVWQNEQPETEIDIDSLDTDMSIKLKYPEEEYYKVRDALAKLASTPEQAIYQLLKL